MCNADITNTIKEDLKFPVKETGTSCTSTWQKKTCDTNLNYQYFVSDIYYYQKHINVLN